MGNDNLPTNLSDREQIIQEAHTFFTKATTENIIAFIDGLSAEELSEDLQIGMRDLRQLHKLNGEEKIEFFMKLCDAESLIRIFAAKRYSKRPSSKTPEKSNAFDFFRRDQTNFYRLPSSPFTNIYYQALAAGNQIEELPERMKQVNHNATYLVTSAGTSRTIKMTQPNASISVTMRDFEAISAGASKPGKKLFVYSLIKLNERAIHNGQVTDNILSFSLNELCANGMYSNPDAARVGVRKGFDALSKMMISGEIRDRKQNLSQDEMAVLFINMQIKNNIVTIKLNPYLNLNILAPYFTLLPRYAFSLSTRAFDLLYLIFYLSRQNIDKIRAQGYFTISMRTIQTRLSLPSEKNTRNPGRLIRDPIEKAIEEIENASQTNELQLTMLGFSDEATVAEFLDSGYLKVELKGTYAKDFIELSKKHSAMIKAAQKSDELLLPMAGESYEETED